jgi:hypothetical protein
VTRAQALLELRTMIGSLDRSDFDGAVERLLERTSLRADALELRSALVEEGARSLLRAAVREGA